MSFCFLLNRVIGNFLCLLFVTSSVLLDSAEYSINQVEYLSSVDINWNPMCYHNRGMKGGGINDHGQIFGMFVIKGSGKYECYFFDPQNGSQSIGDKKDAIKPTCINNLGQITGSCGKNLFIWDQNCGLHKFIVFDAVDVESFKINDLGQVVGRYTTKSNKKRPFLFQNGTIIDLGIGSDFVQKIEQYGYHVMDINIRSINNQGNFVGYFLNGKFNEKTKSYTTIETFAFYWDGALHIIPAVLSRDMSHYEDQLILLLNNNEQVMMTYGKTYLWDKTNGLKVIENFYGIGLNDACEMIGGNAIWRNEQIISLNELLNVDINNIAEPFSDCYKVERIDYILDMNNSGKILGLGTIWGNRYPVVLEPSIEKL